MEDYNYLILENTNDLIRIVNEKFEIEYINEIAHKKVLGYSKNDLIGKIGRKLIHSNELIDLIKIFKSVFKTGEYHREGRIKHKNGDWIWFDIKGKVFQDRDGRTKLLIISRDISDRKKLEQILTESEEKYRLMSENARDVIGVLNKDFEIEYVNEQAVLNLLDYTLEDIIGKSGLSFVHPDDVEQAIKSLTKGLEEGQGMAELRFRHKNGQYYRFEATGRVFSDQRGEIKGTVVLRDITERKKAEVKLRESEEKYRLITENANDLIVVLNENFEYEFINEEVHQRIMGYSKEDVIGKSSFSFVHSDDLEEAVIVLKKGFKKGEGAGEARVRNKKGDYIWLEVKGRTFIDKDEKTKCLLISRDITDRKMAEQKLKESEEKYRRLYENSPDSITLVNDKGIILDVNPSSEEIYRFKKEDVIGKNYMDLGIYTSEQISLFKKRYHKLLEGKPVKPVELQIRKKDGNLAWINYQSSIIKKEDQILIEAIAQDITERKLAELQIIESKEKYQEILDNMREGYFEADLKGNFTFLNRRICDFLGYTKDELVNMNFRQFVKQDNVKNIFKSFNKLFFNGISDKLLEFEILDKLGNCKYVESSVYLKFDTMGNKIGFKGLARDITDKKNAEKIIDKERKKLEELAQLKRTLTTHLSDELNLPLFEISNAIELLLKPHGTKLDENAIVLLNIIKKAGEKTKKMIERISEVSRIASDQFILNKQIINLGVMIVNLLNELIIDNKDKNIKIEIRSSEEIYVEMDQLRIKQAFTFLLNEIIKNSPTYKGFTLIIIKEKDFTEILINTNQFVFEIEIFPFEIDYSREIIELHNGTLNIEHNKQNNTTNLSIKLPIIDWRDLEIHLYIIYKSGVLLYNHSFEKKPTDRDSLIISGGIVGIMSMLKQIIKGNKKIKSIDHGDRRILFELNKTEDVIFAFLVKEDVELLRRKLISIINEFDIIYEENIKQIKMSCSDSNKWLGIEKLVDKYFL